MLSFLLGTYPGMNLLDHTVLLGVTFGGTAKLFSREAIPFYSPTGNVSGFLFLLTNTCYCLSFGCEFKYLIVILISLMVISVEYFFSFLSYSFIVV